MSRNRLDLRSPAGALLPPLAPQVQTYRAEVVRTCETVEPLVLSIVLFGSDATGSYSAAVSDVDLLFVVRETASGEERSRLCAISLPQKHSKALPNVLCDRPGLLECFADRATANERTFLVCTRADLLSGDPARILAISRAQARFVDRGAIPSTFASGAVLWGDDLLPAGHLPPIRRLDVAKAFFSLFSQVLLSAAAYPLLPSATKYAMDAMKRSVHNCYFCYEGRAAPLIEEVRFFDQQQGPGFGRRQLMMLRQQYRPCFAFVLTALPAIARQHWRTATDNQFPRTVRLGLAETGDSGGIEFRPSDALMRRSRAPALVLGAGRRAMSL